MPCEIVKKEMIREELQILMEKEILEKIFKSSKSSVSRNEKSKVSLASSMDEFGFPTHTKEGHPLQSLCNLSDMELKGQSNVTLLLFYAYVEPEWTSAQHEEAIQYAQKVGQEHQMTGRLRVAREGFNGI